MTETANAVNDDMSQTW